MPGRIKGSPYWRIPLYNISLRWLCEVASSQAEKKCRVCGCGLTNEKFKECAAHKQDSDALLSQLKAQLRYNEALRCAFIRICNVVRCGFWIFHEVPIVVKLIAASQSSLYPLNDSCKYTVHTWRRHVQVHAYVPIALAHNTTYTDHKHYYRWT